MRIVEQANAFGILKSVKRPTSPKSPKSPKSPVPDIPELRMCSLQSYIFRIPGTPSGRLSSGRSETAEPGCTEATAFPDRDPVRSARRGSPNRRSPGVHPKLHFPDPGDPVRSAPRQGGSTHRPNSKSRPSSGKIAAAVTVLAHRDGEEEEEEEDDELLLQLHRPDQPEVPAAAVVPAAAARW